ncbi:MAG TPA: hypothetical protein DD400_01860 [Rhodospirillaceae bacterium]|nr:hypothetical protein [Rhodospirillaceae bacterium]
MKHLFPGHFKDNETDLKRAWKNSLFVFDANILLNLYRYSDETRKEFLRILDKIKDRVWLPNRAVEEYLSSRVDVITKQEKAYNDTIASIEGLKSNLDNTRQHPFVNSQVKKAADAAFDSLCEDLKKNKEVHTSRIFNDTIQEEIAQLFEKNVGEPYEKDRLEKIITEGEQRYKEKIPPGYKDASKFDGSEVFTEKCKKYGDLILWMQVIDKAISSKKGIILITDDKKEDWWLKSSGKTIGGQPELIKEFKDKANKPFHMYQADLFLKLATANLGEKVSEEMVEEIREVRRRDILESRRVKETQIKNDDETMLIEAYKRRRHKERDYVKQKANLLMKLKGLENDLAFFNKKKSLFIENMNLNEEANLFNDEYENLMKQYEDTKKSLSNLRIDYNRYRHMIKPVEWFQKQKLKSYDEEDD